MRTTRKYDSIDIMKLYTLGSANGWNKFLDKCFYSQSINELARVRYSLQAGMTDIAKQKLNDDKINVFYIRLMKSLEDTAKKILRVKYPLAPDNPLNKDKDPRVLEAKRKRDKELEMFFNQSSF